jgi:hypothetical protein
MDINAAAGLQNMITNNPYKPKQASKNSGTDFGKVFSDVSSQGNKKTVKNDRTTQENYDAVLAGAGIIAQAVSQTVPEEIGTGEEAVMSAVDSLSAGLDAQAQAADVIAQIAFGDASSAFADMLSSQLLVEYIAQKYPTGTNGQNPKGEFTEDVSQAVLNVVGNYSGFTETQMTNPNMTVDVIGLDKFANEDFINDISNEIISVVFDGNVKDESALKQTVKDSLEKTLLNPTLSVKTDDSGISGEELNAVNTDNASAEAVVDISEQNNIQESTIQPNTVQESVVVQPNNTQSDTISTNFSVSDNAPETNEVDITDTGERMIAMTDGTYIPESQIMKSSNIPDENGIYPAGTQYIESTSFIGKGDSPATAVLMAKVGDEDGLIRPSDFIAARNIVFNKHENIPDTVGEAVYMPINGMVSGTIEYAGSDNTDLSGEAQQGQQNQGGLDFMNMSSANEVSPFMTDVSTDAQIINTDFQVPQNAVQASNSITDMVERMTNNLIQTEDGAVKQMQIQLHPETLGNIVIKLESTQGQMSVKIITSNPEVRDMIAQSAMQMADSIRSQGINLTNIDVSQSANEQQNFDGSSGNSAYYSGSQQQQNQRNEREGQNYREYMEAAEQDKIRRVLDSIRSFGL